MNKWHQFKWVTSSEVYHLHELSVHGELTLQLVKIVGSGGWVILVYCNPYQILKTVHLVLVSFTLLYRGTESTRWGMSRGADRTYRSDVDYNLVQTSLVSQPYNLCGYLVFRL
jgi:hypothetical protein